MTRGVVLDTGALIALERPVTLRRMMVVLDDLGSESQIVVSAGSLAEAWRGTPRQAQVALLLRRPATRVEEITVPTAKAIGIFLGRRSDGDDIVDAHVVMLARHHRLPVITSDPGDLRALDPELSLVRI